MPDLVRPRPQVAVTLAPDPLEGQVRVSAALSRTMASRQPPAPARTVLAAGASVAASLMRAAESERASEVSLWDGSRISFSRIGDDAKPEPF